MSPAQSGTQTGKPIHSVVSAFRVLETVAEMQPVGLSDLAREVGLPKSSTQRALLTLAEIGWLRASEESPTRWGLTYRALRLSRNVDERSGLRAVALPVMNELQLATTETVHLTAPDGDALVLLERLDTPHPLRAFLPLGERVPLHASATGLAFLAASADEAVDHYLAGGLASRTPDTLTDAAEVRAAIATIRERGWSTNIGGLSTGISSVGAAITDRAGTPVGAVSLSGPSSRMVPERFDDLGPQVARAATRIGAEL
jgi:IclR family acetate operon transcriptional repressor